MEHFMISRTVFNKAKKNNFIICVKYAHKHTQETKFKLSQIMKERLKNNGNHVWKRNDKFLSKPCEIFKNFLLENNINFYP